MECARRHREVLLHPIVIPRLIFKTAFLGPPTGPQPALLVQLTNGVPHTLQRLLGAAMALKPVGKRYVVQSAHRLHAALWVKKSPATYVEKGTGLATKSKTKGCYRLMRCRQVARIRTNAAAAYY